ncbi:hypothetical protein [Sporosarcina sp. SG10008]|uniref:hypothetical protein n=1 Tax=Sporosarcina sp. SG10008 TaxID=3373103 RepID=UPI0037DBF535
MKKVLFILIVSMSVFFSAWQTKELTFIGEGENWWAEVTVAQTDGDEQYEIQIFYKGNELESVKTFDYFVETSTDGVLNFGTNNVSLNEKGKFQHKSLSSNSPSTKQEEKLVLKVVWNGITEKIFLEN